MSLSWTLSASLGNVQVISDKHHITTSCMHGRSAIWVESSRD
jgi:hypothetical protein